MKSIGRFIGYSMWIISGLLMFLFWFMAMSKWMGFIGGMLAFAIAPGFIIFPIIFWIVEGVFPVLYFSLLGSGFLGMIIVGACSDNEY